MELQELLADLRKRAADIDVSNVDFLAVQINLEDMNPGVFYVEIKDHRINIEPYEYIDKNCALTVSSGNFKKLIDGKLDPVKAFTLRKLRVDGDVGKALEFSNVLRNR
ncbi:MAG: SCP2 sterol-binding domain-containing protein [Porcipelethomonas sp.]